ncbi:MAG: UDP-N-acetylmuramate--L-alanine ligase [Caldilineales bacterium]|nr:UDP-N-acetylmuramate--L-alanine ligase [Caldilineales bacterium]
MTPHPHTAPWQHLLRLPPERRSAVRIHLVGIGGAGLSAIARVLLGQGYTVTGSDARPGPALAELEALGATVFVGHRAEHAAGADLVLVSSAVPGDNPEVVAAQQAGIPVVKRDQFLAPLMAGHLNICVAGSHGKTTTSAMVVTLLDALGAEPSFIVGSTISHLGTAARAGRSGGPFVLEADEYDHTFLGLEPQVAVITNVDWDHVDCYPTPETYHQAFADFARLVPRSGAVIFCGDDPGAAALSREAAADGPPWISYGLAQSNRWRAHSLQPEGRGVRFQVERDGVALGEVRLAVPGRHNVLNALAALAAVEAAGYVFTDEAKNLKNLSFFCGTSRRLEHKGTRYGIIVVDDYAHHPTEVRATLSAARQRFPHRTLWVLFQPHTYSRTRALLTDFCRSLESADHVLITAIYAAREHDPLDISAQDLAAGLASHPDARYVGDLDAAVAVLSAEAQPGDVVLTLGAGDVTQAGDRLLAALGQRELAAAAAPVATLRFRRLTEAIRREVGLEVLHDVPLAPHTTLKVGGPADLLVTATSAQQLATVLRLAREHDVPATVLGGGSNVVISDAGVRGLVVINAGRGVRRHEGHVVWAESGANLAGLARQTVRWGLGGLEWAVSVPGTVGGAVVGNAGAHGGCIADNLLRATLLMPDGRVEEWPARRFGYAYRHSALKEMLRDGRPTPVVLAAAFQLSPDDPAALEERAAQFLAHRRRTQPVEASAGSIFQNPPGDFAGRILDSLGFKGRQVGGAMVSPMHANFIVNTGAARAADVVALINQARAAAWAALGVELVPEVLFLGDWPQHPPFAPVASSASRAEVRP